MDTDSFVIHIKTEDFFEDINNDVKRWFDTSNYGEIDKTLLKIGANKKVIEMFNDKLGGKIMKEFCALKAETYAYLMDSDSEKKKNNNKGTKKCLIKREAMFKNYKDSLLNDEIILKSQLRFKSNYNNVHTEKINKIVPSNDDDKRLETFDKITTYPYGTNAFKVCGSEMMKKYANFQFYDEIVLQQK